MPLKYNFLALIDAGDLLCGTVACALLAAAVRIVERRREKKEKPYAFQLLCWAAAVLLIATIIVGWMEARGPFH